MILKVVDLSEKLQSYNKQSIKCF